MTDAAHALLTIDLDALAANFHALAAVAGDAEVAPVVKADGYGLGAGPVARRLWAEGARRFFVARIEEGERLREALAGRAAVIHVLDGAPEGAMPRLAAARLIPVLNSFEQIETARAFAGRQGRVEVGLHIDTGMNRLGLRPEEAQALAEARDRLAGLDLTLAMSHLACGNEPDHPMNARQLARFTAAAAGFPGARLSLANSGGVFLGDAYRFDVVRPGISLYGGGPFGQADARLRPVARLEAPILQLRTVPAGESVGYGAGAAADGSRRLAVIGAGYANGFLRASGPAGGVWFDGARRPIVGSVSMDMVTIDVTGAATARPGAMAELIGPNATLDEAAHAAGTAPHELLVRIGMNVRRAYLGEAA